MKISVNWMTKCYCLHLDKYVTMLNGNRGTVGPAALQNMFLAEEIRDLVSSGFLTVSHHTISASAASSRPGGGSSEYISRLVQVSSKQASGSLGSAGGADALISAGVGSGTLHQQASTTSNELSSSHPRDIGSFIHSSDNIQFEASLPSTGPYLRLVDSARSHFMSLLLRSTYKEAPVDHLRQRWNGGTFNNSISLAKRSRGESGGVLPGNTRKWRDLSGLTFDWILGECVSAGLVELFETGAIGRGLRAR